MSETPQFQCYLFYYYYRDHYDFGKEIAKLESNRSKDFFFLKNTMIGRTTGEHLWLWPEKAQKYLHTAPCSKSLETTALDH